MPYNVVDRVHMFMFPNILGCFRGVASRVMLNMLRHWSDTPSGSLLSITSVHAQICRGEFSKQSLRIVKLV